MTEYSQTCPHEGRTRSAIHDVARYERKGSDARADASKLNSQVAILLKRIALAQARLVMEDPLSDQIHSDIAGWSRDQEEIAEERRMWMLESAKYDRKAQKARMQVAEYFQVDASKCSMCRGTGRITGNGSASVGGMARGTTV